VLVVLLWGEPLNVTVQLVPEGKPNSVNVTFVVESDAANATLTEEPTSSTRVMTPTSALTRAFMNTRASIRGLINAT